MTALALHFSFAVQPYVRMTQAGRWTDAAEAYRENQTELARAIEGECRAKGYEPFLDTARLEVGIIVARAPYKTYIAPTEKRRGHERTVDPIKKADIDNFAKAVLDACQKAGLFKNDTQVYWLVAEKLHADTDELSIEIWDRRESE
jgi:hypothetical protein